MRHFQIDVINNLIVVKQDVDIYRSVLVKTIFCFMAASQFFLDKLCLMMVKMYEPAAFGAH